MIYSLTAPILDNPGFIFANISPRAVVRPRLTIARIKEIVTSFYDISMASMDSDRRARSVARPRQIAMFLSRELTPKSLPCIGREFNRDHTTVIHSCRQVERLRLIDGDIADDLVALRERLAG